MTRHATFERITALTAISSAPLAFACLFFALDAVHFDVDALADPSTAWVSGARAAQALRRSMVLDMFGYYLLLVPAVIWLDRELRPRAGPIATLVTACGFGYVLVGAIGAAVLAAALPHLLTAHAQASASERETIAIVVRASLDTVHGGLWNLLEMLLAGVFWSGAGVLLLRRRPHFAVLTLVLGASAALDGIGSATEIAPLASTSLSVYLVLAPVWALCLGVLAARDSAGPRTRVGNAFSS